MKKYIFGISLLLSGHLLYAGNFEPADYGYSDSEMQIMKEQSEEAKNKYLTEADSYSGISKDNELKQKAEAKQLAKEAREKFYSMMPKQEESKSEYDGAMIFVTLSMPESSLKKITEDASRYGIPVIIRGLYNNNYRETLNKVVNIITGDKEYTAKGGISIDPTWFDMYDIQKVPAFVLTDQTQACNEGNKDTCKVENYDILYGNIKVDDALRIFSRKGDFKDKAKSILAKGDYHA